MSMYNLVFGESPAADGLLAILGLSKEHFYRYRDAYLSEDGEIAVYTRGGGGNRECHCDDYGEVLPEGEDHEAGCVAPMQDALRQHALYLRDEDDDYDCTYATFYFRVPDEAKATVAGIPPEVDRDAAWVAFLDALRASSQ